MTNGPYNPSVVLYRKALASAERARRISSSEIQVMANPRQREADDTIIAIVLAHAAIESAWHWEQAQTGVGPLKWPRQLERALAEVAAVRGWPSPGKLDSTLDRRFERLGAWRNFLQHGNESARKNLRRLGGDPDDPTLLIHQLAAEAADVATEMLKHFAAVAGAQLVPSPSAWIDPSEVGCCL